MTDECEFNQEDYCILRLVYPECERCEFEGDSSEIGVGLCNASDYDLMTEEEWEET